MEEDELCFPQFTNLSCRKLNRSQFEKVLISFMLCFISVTTVSLNLLVIISISHFRQLHTSTNLVLLSLAVSDFSVGFLILFQLMLIDGCWYLNDSMCVLYYILDVVVTSASVGNMVLVSIDRYVAICDPLHYSLKVTPKRARVCISLCWISSLSYVTIVLRMNFKEPGRFNSCFGECVINVGFTEQVADLFVTFIIPITVIVVLYVRVFLVAAAQVQAMRSHVAAVTHQHSRKIIVKDSEMKAAKILGVVVVAFLMCLCPYFCVTLVGQDTLLNTLSSAFVICLFYFNSCLNPLIYAFFYPWFRNSIKYIISLQILKPGSCDANIL
ncbi:trace amine-associated receptor 8a-like [Poecilia reticulata]|uniref:trace amine-associated receptor 8a-like n=1 Tax=Poecilia reticulata TaxID=8081 RepID=UPI0007EA84F6|nr:PREDICTED: trace amine-associated receptor 8a-like [Poecilia reticulata]